MSLTPTLLLILDGYGLAPAGPGNAASLARTPNIDRLISLPGATRIDASGRAVGLPAGYMGNSEVGHLNIGAGRIVYQDMTRIDVAMETGELASNAALLELLANDFADGLRSGHLRGEDLQTRFGELALLEVNRGGLNAGATNVNAECLCSLNHLQPLYQGMLWVYSNRYVLW